MYSQQQEDRRKSRFTDARARTHTVSERLVVIEVMSVFCFVVEAADSWTTLPVWSLHGFICYFCRHFYP